MTDSSWLSELEHDLTLRERDLRSLNADQQFELIHKRAREFVDGDRLKVQLAQAKKTGKPLLIKYGIDPTAQDIHLGHIVPIIVARRFMQMGHRVAIVFGDFTALVGDPTGRVSTRPVLTPEQIQENVGYYKQQVGKFIDLKKIEIIFNSAFYTSKNMSVADFLRILSKNGIAPLLQREDFRKRQDTGLTIAEVLYPTLMAIDSIKMGAQIELGGIDQLLNFHTAKTFMLREGLEPETAVTTDLLESTAGDGKKMSKSEGNYVAISASPDEAYGKLMSIPDRLLETYFKLLTDITDEQWKRLAQEMQSDLSPKVVKQLLARILVTWLHSKKAAVQAEENFSKVFSKREVPDNLTTVKITFSDPLTWLDIAEQAKISSSRSAFRRLIESKTVKVVSEDNRIVTDPFEKVSKGTYTIRFGKGKFINIEVT